MHVVFYRIASRLCTCNDLSIIKLLFVVMGYAAVKLEIVLGSGNSCVIKPRRTSTCAQRVHGSGIVHVLFSF